MNMTVTNVDLRGLVAAGHPVYEDELLTFAAPGTVLAGTILARDTTTLALVPFVKGGATDGNGIPVAVLTSEVTATGAGDVPVRPLLSGEVWIDKLVIAADGDASNVDAAVLDGLRTMTIIGRTVTELNIPDNQ